MCQIRTEASRILLQAIWDQSASTEHHVRQTTALVACGNFLFSASLDCTIVRFHPSTGDKNFHQAAEMPLRLEGHTGPVFALCTVGEHVVSGAMDRRIGVWHGGTGHLVRWLEGHAATVSCLHALRLPNTRCSTAAGDESGDHFGGGLTGDGGAVKIVVLSGSLDKTVGVWDAGAGGDPEGWRGAGAFAGHRECVNCVGGWEGRAVSGSSDGTVALWRPEGGLDRAEAVLDCGEKVGATLMPSAIYRLVGFRILVAGIISSIHFFRHCPCFATYFWSLLC
jgi:WD40 repeat protein